MRESSVFVREATGLVRSVSFLDAVFSNLAIINIASALTFPVLLIAYSFPGANIPLAFLLTLPLVLIYNLLYSYFIKMMPRSGGDYVFISRGLHPLLGFAANFSFVMWNTFWIGVYSSWVSTIGLSSLFYATGLNYGSSLLRDLGTALSTPTSGFLVGTVIVILIAALSISGTKKTMTFQKVLVIIGILGVIVGVALPLLFTNSTFATAISKYASYEKIIQSGISAGYSPAPFSLNATILATGLVALTMLFGQFSVYMGGEIRRPERSIPNAIIITTIVTTGLLVIGGYIVNSVFGTNFSGAIQTLYYNGSADYPFQVAPYYNFLVSLLTGNPFIIILIGLSFTLWTMSGAIFNLLANSRCVLAWSFDRIFPARMAYVSERFHTPIYAIIFNVAIAEFLLYLYSFNISVVSFMAGTTLGYIFTFGSTALAGILIPFLGRSRRIYESSSVRRNFLGIPVITLLGVGTLAYFSVLGYGLLSNGTFGVNSPPSLLAIAAFWIAGIVIGSIFIVYRKRQGVDISAAFSSIPPE